MQAHKFGDDAWALLTDDDGFITEGTGANFFIVKNGELITPEPRNILRGVTRETIINLAEKLGIKCHEKNIPVIYTTGTVREDGWDSGGWAWKNNRTDEDVTTPNATGFNRDGNEIMDQIAPSAQDIVIYKHKPSAFSGTPLSGFLNDLGADSLLVTGTTTSGCVRASVIDAFSQNMRVTVVEEGCFDRSQASHAINLCDMHAKDADVQGLEEVINFVDGLDVDMNVPTGKPL